MSRRPFNLIVTHEPGYENFLLAKQQVLEILGEASIIDTAQSIMLLRVDDPYKAAKMIAEGIPESTPILRAVPVDEVVEPTTRKVGETVGRLAEERIPPTSTFRIKLDGYLYRDMGGVWQRLHKQEAIEEIARHVDRPVNLSKPDWLIYIKVVRMHGGWEYAAIMVAPPSSIFSRFGGGSRG